MAFIRDRVSEQGGHQLLERVAEQEPEGSWSEPLRGSRDLQAARLVVADSEKARAKAEKSEKVKGKGKGKGKQSSK